jgi:hypothetical protein
MPFNIPILLIPLLGGFVFVTYCNRTKWYAVRAEKERLTLYASLAGLLHLGIAWTITSLIPHLPCIAPFPCFSNTWAMWQHFWAVIRPFPYFGTTILAFGLASLSWLPLNRYCFKKDEETYRIIVQEGGPLEQLLDLAMHTQKQVMITLKTDKVYIGVIDSSFTPGQLSRTIQLLPNKSGYRSAGEKKTIPTTDYDAVYSAIGEDFAAQGRNTEQYEVLIEDFRIVIALDDIASISLYWPEIDARYFKGTVPRDMPLPSFETVPLPTPPRTPDPILRTLHYIGSIVLYPIFNERETPFARMSRMVFSISLILAIVLVFFYSISN